MCIFINELYLCVVRAPGIVSNVTCNVTGNSNLVVVSWLPPSDMGTSGQVTNYYIEWGQQEYSLLPQLKQEGLANVSGVSCALKLSNNYFAIFSSRLL